MADLYTVSAQDLARLTTRQYQVTQENATEPAFDNEFWDHHEVGIYVDVVTGEPLFASTQKYDSGCGWPSFTAPLEPGHLDERLDVTVSMVRTEVRSARGDSHLGHVFADGPAADGGRRYCINSAALRFVAYEDLDDAGLGQYRRLLEGAKEEK